MKNLPFRTRMRVLRMGFSTLTGGRPGGWFIPYRYAHTVKSPGAYPSLEPLFAAAEPRFAEMLQAIDRHAPALEAIGGEPPLQPRWAQGWFPRLDAAAAYAIVRDRAPARIVEVGSGHSTRFMARAIADGGLATRLTAIDPAPRADIAALDVDHVQATAHNADIALFEELRPGDVLFVDSSHILMPGTDVDFFLNRIWPMLPAGVLVHFHDILLPDDYPPAWQWRGYNEQLGVAPLLSSGAADTVFASRYVATRMAGSLAETVLGRLPMMDVALETSLWLEKRVEKS